MIKVLIFTKFFGSGAGGHPEALLSMSHTMKKYIVFDVYTADGISKNIGNKSNLHSIPVRKNKNQSKNI